jgi:transaldolase
VLFLDAADPDDIAAAADLGFVSGVTLNPALVARCSSEPLDHLKRLLDLFPGTILFQPSAADVAAAELEVRAALEEDRVVAKLPATPEHARLTLQLREEGFECALTAVYSAGQAILAHEVGCRWIIPYVDRARRLLPEGEGLVGNLARVLETLRSETRILAASIKSSEQAVAAIKAGAAGVSCPLVVLTELMRHPLTETAIREFEAAGAAAKPAEAIGRREAP